MEIDKEKEEMIINFGAFGYEPEKMANILLWDIKEVENAMEDKASTFFRLYLKGQELADYVLDLKLFEMAQSGDLKAMQKFEHRLKTRRK